MNNVSINLNGYSGQNSTIALFTEIYINLPLFWKYIKIYHFFSTRVWGIRVFHGTRVPSKNFRQI